jgi:hypothetical protein
LRHYRLDSGFWHVSKVVEYWLAKEEYALQLLVSIDKKVSDAVPIGEG